jgi:hypothetical protein
MSESVSFNLNDCERLTLELPISLEKTLECDWVKLYYYHNQDQYLLSETFIAEIASSLIRVLQKALNNNLLLDESIKQDIGFMWNRSLSDDSDFVYKGNVWIGLTYCVWEVPGSIQPNLTTWLYNDIEGNIILEMTENYIWHYFEPSVGKNYSTHEEFMKNYRPFRIRIISREMAYQWLELAKFVLSMVEDNEERVCKEHM